MILGVFGGSFDPPHICHVLVCQYVLAMEHVQRVLVIPAFSHPFAKDQAPFADRLAMARLAMRPLGERVEVCDIESRREGPSYTADTLRELRRLHPHEEFRLIVGSDILGEIDRWHDYEAVERLAPPLVVPRAEGPLDRQDRFAFPALSSTGIRRAMAAGEDVSAAVPPAVLAYIREQRLYGA